MAIDIKDLIGDKSVQEEGKELDFEGGAKFHLVYADSPKPRRFYLNGMNKLRRKAGGGMPKAEKQQALLIDQLVEHVVKGWSGLVQPDPQDETKKIEFPYSKENCRKLLEQSTRIRDWVTGESNDITNFGGKVADDDDMEDEANASMKSGAPVEP